MLNISYNISPRLQEYLRKIEDLRKQILLTPILPEKEIRLRWDATFNRIYSSLKISGSPIQKKEMLKLLSEVIHKKVSSNQQAVFKYKKALDYISRNWQGSQEPIKAQTIIDLQKIIGNGALRVPQAGLQHLIDYLQSKSENPIIQAAIINIELEKMRLFTKNNTQIAHLAADLILYKYGYDLKGFLSYEKAWTDDQKVLSKEFKEYHDRALSAVSLTLWLEYFASSILESLETIIQSITRPKTSTISLRDSFWRLNERQRSILSLLDQPQLTITNRQVQKRFKTSQITASRDLAKLTNLGCLFSHGKGRSVYYTKI